MNLSEVKDDELFEALDLLKKLKLSLLLEERE
jgi:hypothetical protein